LVFAEKPAMPDNFECRTEDERATSRVPRACGKIFPLPGEIPRETPNEFAVGMGAWSGDLLLALGPDGDLYYTTFAGDGQVRKIVVSDLPNAPR
jgi:hypothetical protein